MPTVGERHFGAAVSAAALVSTLCLAGPANAHSTALSEAVDSAVEGNPADTYQGPPDLPANNVQDIVVSATRNTERVHDVPVSASVISAAAVQAISANGQDMRVLAFTVPSLNVETTQGRNFPRFYIRGYGNTDYGPFASQPVSLVYDDVVQENPNLKGFPMFDIADVQVYRGPQGTLFGRNAPAGVVSVQSRKPLLGSFGGNASVSEGSYNTASFDGAVNFPASDVIAVRVSLQHQHRDDWVHDPITKSNYGGWDDFAGRIQLLYKPSDDFSALLNVHGRVLDGASTMWRANAIVAGSNRLSAITKQRTIYADQPDTQTSRTVGANARLTWKLGPVTLFSITGWEGVPHADAFGDIDGGYGAVYAPPSGPGFIPFAVATSNGINHLGQITQEFRLASATGGAFQYQAGVYFFHENAATNAIDFDGLSGVPLDYESSRQVNNAAAIFGSATYKITDHLQIRAGLRYTHDHKVFDITKLVNLSYSPTHARAVANNVSWDASATYEINPDVNLYVRAATGFRAPSFGSPTSVNGLQVARSETNTSYEGGLKTFLFDRKVSADVSLFYYHVHNQQLTAVGGSNNAIRLLNAKRTIGYGAEWEMRAQVADGLSFNFSGSYNFTKLKDPSLAVAVCAACTVTDPLNAEGNALIDGNPLPQAAKYIVDVSVTYEHPISGSNAIFFQPDLSYRSKVNFFLYESKEFAGKEFLNLGLRGGLRFADGNYEAAVFCRNCANTTRTLEGIDFDNLTAVLNDPRIIGVQLSAKF